MKKRGATIRHKNATMPGLLALAVCPGYETRLRLAVSALSEGWMEVSQYDDLADTIDMLQIGMASYSQQKPDPSTEVAIDVCREAMMSIRGRYIRTGKFGATGEELKAVQLLADVSLDFWSRRSGALFAFACQQLKELRLEQREQAKQSKEEAEMNARDNAPALPAIDGIINAAHKALADSKAPLCAEDVAKSINGTKRATKPQIKEAEKQLKELYGLGILESNARTGGVSFYSLNVAPAQEAKPGIPAVEDDGCGACGDACASNGGACRVKEESPPVPLDAKQDRSIYDEMVGRFLGWKLPDDFSPDGGIHFSPSAGFNPSGPHWPTGTNLLNAEQAEWMFRRCVPAEVCDLVQTGGESQTVAETTERQLKDWAQAEREDLHAEYGRDGNCSCHLGAPCASCSHPGNPLQQAEDPDCWETIGDEMPPADPVLLASANRMLSDRLEGVAHALRGCGLPALVEVSGAEDLQMATAALSGAYQMAEAKIQALEGYQIQSVREFEALSEAVVDYMPDLNSSSLIDGIRTMDLLIDAQHAQLIEQDHRITSLAADVMRTRGSLNSAINEADRMRAELAVERQACKALQEQINAAPAAAAKGYVLKTPKRAMRRFGEEAAAQSAAMAAARAGKTGEVFALIPVGRAVRGAEWKAV